MKRSFSVILLLTCIILQGFSATNLDVLLEQSINLWDKTVPWVRLGSAPALQDYDPTPLVQDILQDVERAGRYQEFEYLFSYLASKISEKSLVLRIIQENPPSPGFWPAMVDQSQYAIVISFADLDYLQEEPYLLRASFLRAVSTLYYIECAPFPAVYRNMRNPLCEFPAFMTGNHIESIYLREIVPFNKMSSIAKDWHGWLFDSAQNDNLADLAEFFYGITMHHAYGFIGELNHLTNLQQVFNLYKTMYEIDPVMFNDMLQLVYGSEYSNAKMGYTGTFARTMLIMYPWILFTLQTIVPHSSAKTDFLKLQEAIIEKLQVIQKLNAYMDPIVLAIRQENLNRYKFNASDKSMATLIAAESSTNKKISGLPNRPETAKINWFYDYINYGYTDYAGTLPLSEKEALNTKAYRFSYNNKGQLIAIESFYKGKLCEDSDRLDAAQIEIIRDDTCERWYWKNVSGKLTMNKYGFAVLKIANKETGQYFAFYSDDGRRIPNDNGIWTIQKQLIPNGFEYRFFDGSGRATTSYNGVSVQRFVKQDNNWDIRFFGSDNNPVKDNSIDAHRIYEKHIINASTHIIEVSYYDENLNPCMKRGEVWIERYSTSRERVMFELLDQKGKPVLGICGFSKVIHTVSKGLVIRSVFMDITGKEVNTMTGFSRQQYSYNNDGNITEVIIFNSNNKPATNMEGIHKRVMKYDKNGFMEELYFYDTNGKPVNDTTGAARIRWINDEDGTILGMDAWNANGFKLTNRFQMDI